MAIVFRDRALAELCNSQARLNERWGETLGAEIARRLFELHAADASTIQSLPHAQVAMSQGGSLTVEFQHGLAMRCERGSPDLPEDYFVIIDIYVDEEER